LGDPRTKKDFFKILFLLGTLLVIPLIFQAAPSLTTPTLLSVLVALLFSPWVAALERRGYPSRLSIGLLFLILAVISLLLSLNAYQYVQTEWESLQVQAPRYFEQSMARLRAFEAHVQSKYPALSHLRVSDQVVGWGELSWQWVTRNGTDLMGQILGYLFLVPIISFFLLTDGPTLKRKFFNLVPNRYFEAVFRVTHEITTSLADYIRAKILEGFLVGVMTGVGLYLVGAPYSIVLGIVAGVTNIIPYAGPILGAIPALLVCLFDPAVSPLLWPVVAVFLVANLIDTVFIFPVIVAKLVDLHPLILITAVIAGQQYYGLIGMLLSIPIASALKVIALEIHSVVYGVGSGRSESQ
jgi:putative permease